MAVPGLETILDGLSTAPPEYAAIVALETVASIAILAVSLALFARRRQTSYLFVTAAFSTLVIRSALGLLTVFGLLAIDSHHVLEHGLDVLLIGLLFLAVIVAQRSEYANPRSNS
ncbi:DUF7471 family protein [Natronorubrum sp. FCH18a]|uniref:DUF7471 family protein n=1 Tax=Natronorubrum sp. FCH18a TaxID=3447018 RepID=UPI003F516E59